MVPRGGGEFTVVGLVTMVWDSEIAVRRLALQSVPIANVLVLSGSTVAMVMVRNAAAPRPA